MSFCLFELAKNTEIQRKLQQEIDRVLEKFDNQVTYDGIMEMQFLEQCMDGKSLNL
jgi:cytochrome P450 family 6